MIELRFPFVLDVVVNSLASDTLLYSRRMEASSPIRLFCGLLPTDDT